MAQESYADFSIIKKYFEIKNRYEIDIQGYKERLAALEAQHKQQMEKALNDISARDAQLQAREQQLQELANKLKENEEQLKTLGLQVYKMKTELEEARNRAATDEEKKGKFSMFK
jgi:hypothetical protein